MRAKDSLGQFEQLVLTAVLSLESDAYGVTIHKKVEALSAPKSVTLGAVYVTLDRLDDKAYLSSWLDRPDAGARRSGQALLQSGSRRRNGLARVDAGCAPSVDCTGNEMGKGMDLKFRRRLVSALLPFEYREHVLGDLEERRFPLLDVVSIFPRVWLTHLRRDSFTSFRGLPLAVVAAFFCAVIKMPYSVAAVVVPAFVVAALFIRNANFTGDRRTRLLEEQAWARPGVQLMFLPNLPRIVSYLWPSSTKTEKFVVVICAVSLLSQGSKPAA